MKHTFTLISFSNNQLFILAEVYKGKKGYKVIMTASSFWVKDLSEV
jgi:hypothetical protein